VTSGHVADDVLLVRNGVSSMNSWCSSSSLLFSTSLLCSSHE